MRAGYDTPEDEQAADEERARRAARVAAQEPEPFNPRPRRVYANGLWDTKRGCMVPDTVGVVVYPEDYL